MKKLMFCMVLLSLNMVGIDRSVQSIQAKPSFRASKEEELEEVIAYFVKSKAEEETVEDVRRDILLGSKLLNYPADVIPLPRLYDYFISNRLQDLQDIQKTFDALKVLMGIPEEVQIMISTGASIIPSSLMGYHSLDRVVYVYPSFIDHSCHSYQLFTLIHELIHAQQHMCMGLIESKLCSNVDKEFEADSQAAQAIKCPVCMQAIEAEQLLREATVSEDTIMENYKNGYLVGKEITDYKNAKIAQDYCDFHKSDTSLNERLRSASLREIFDIDRKSGSLFDRLSTVSYNVYKHQPLYGARNALSIKLKADSCFNSVVFLFNS